MSSCRVTDEVSSGVAGFCRAHEGLHIREPRPSSSRTGIHE